MMMNFSTSFQRCFFWLAQLAWVIICFFMLLHLTASHSVTTACRVRFCCKYPKHHFWFHLATLCKMKSTCIIVSCMIKPLLLRMEYRGIIGLEWNILEIFSQIIGDTIEQNLRVLQAQRGFVFDSGFQESKKSSPSQVLGCGYGLMWKSDKYELSGVSESAEKMTGLIIICLE